MSDVLAVEVGVPYEHASGERFAVIEVATSTAFGTEGERWVVYHRIGEAELLVKPLAEWCEIVNGRPRFWRVDGA